MTTDTKILSLISKLGEMHDQQAALTMLAFQANMSMHDFNSNHHKSASPSAQWKPILDDVYTKMGRLHKELQKGVAAAAAAAVAPTQESLQLRQVIAKDEAGEPMLLTAHAVDAIGCTHYYAGWSLRPWRDRLVNGWLGMGWFVIAKIDAIDLETLERSQNWWVNDRNFLPTLFCGHRRAGEDFFLLLLDEHEEHIAGQDWWKDTLSPPGHFPRQQLTIRVQDSNNEQLARTVSSVDQLTQLVLDSRPALGLQDITSVKGQTVYMEQA